jgi:hypothetical protein
MIIGGGDHGGMYNAINNVHIINLSDSNPTYVSTGSLNHARLHHSAILLPDRTVLVCNGNLRGDNPTPPEKEAEIYNPVTGIWTVVATAAVPRNYHSLGLLLPDGRVATAGSNPASQTKILILLQLPFNNQFHQGIGIQKQVLEMRVTYPQHPIDLMNYV